MTSRRALVVGAAATVGATLPAPANASERIRAAVDAQRAAWAARREDLVRRASGGRELSDEQRWRLESLGDGLGALGALKAVGLPSVEEQAHPAFQSLLRDVAEAVGRAVVVGADLLDAFLPGAGVPEEAALRGEVERMRAGLPSWRVDDTGREQIDTHLRGLLRPEGEGELLRGGRRVRDRARKAQRLGEELRASDWSSGMVAGDPRVGAAEVAVARARWAAEGEDVDPERYRMGPQLSYVAMGLLLLGLVLVEGLVFLVALCSALCSNNGTALVLVIVIGVAIIGLTVYGAIWAFSKAAEEARGTGRRRREPALPEGDDLPDEGD